MRRFMTGLCLAGLIGVGIAGTALAAFPPPNRHFSGSGGNFWSHNGRWVRHGTRSFSFTTSPRGFFRYVDNFRARYTTPCGGPFRVRATDILIHKSTGKFHARFRSHGAWVKIWGRFTGRGDVANVNFIANFSGSSTNPSTASFARCAAWVHGKAIIG